MGVPQNGWFIKENPLKWMIWGTPISGNPHIKMYSVNIDTHIQSRCADISDYE